MDDKTILFLVPQKMNCDYLLKLIIWGVTKIKKHITELVGQFLGILMLLCNRLGIIDKFTTMVNSGVATNLMRRRGSN